MRGKLLLKPVLIDVPRQTLDEDSLAFALGGSGGSSSTVDELLLLGSRRFSIIVLALAYACGSVSK
jgi:hypothetical protein